MVAVASVYFAAICFLFARNLRLVGMVLLLIPIVSANAFVNPIGFGLAGFYRNETFGWLRTLAAEDHRGRWLVLGEDRRTDLLAYLIKAAGSDVLGGIRNNPDMRVFGVLDPERKYFAVWNRFAVVSYKPSEDDQVGMTLTSGVSYTITLPLTPELLDRLGINHILDVDMPARKTELRGFHLAAQRDGMLLHVRDAQ
jgi:hypothetical protein